MSKVRVPKVVRALEATESPLPPQIQEVLGELVGAAREGLLALSVGVGLGVVHELMELEIDEVVGPKGKHDPDRVAVRHGVYREFVQKPGVGTRDEGERRLPRCMEGGSDRVAAAAPQKQQCMIAGVEASSGRFCWDSGRVVRSRPRLKGPLDRLAQRSELFGG